MHVHTIYMLYTHDKGIWCMEYSQVERRRFLVPRYKGSNPFTPTDVDVQYVCAFLQTYCSTHNAQ